MVLLGVGVINKDKNLFLYSKYFGIISAITRAMSSVGSLVNNTSNTAKNSASGLNSATTTSEIGVNLTQNIYLKSFTSSLNTFFKSLYCLL